MSAAGTQSFAIVVEPWSAGWAVRCTALANPMVYRSGAAAEQAARRLAARLAHAGRFAQITVRLKDGSPVARFVCPPAPAVLEAA